MPHVTAHFPKAQTFSSLLGTVLELLGEHQLKAAQCVWGTSICSDEVTNILKDFNPHFVGPGPFRFGGISGLPFTGRTGFRAFASHIPENGGAFILFGPHIGISGEGKIGEIQREGQSKPTTCCGSLIVGLNAVQKGMVPLVPRRDDYQQGQVSNILALKQNQINTSQEPVKTVTEIMYRQIQRELTDIIADNIEMLGNAKVLLVGGIVINTDWTEDDYFEIRDVMVLGKGI